MFHIFKSRQMNYKSGQTRCFSLAVQSVESKLFHFPKLYLQLLAHRKNTEGTKAVFAVISNLEKLPIKKHSCG